MIYETSHRSRFRYDHAVSVAHHLLHLSPREHPRQRRHRSVLNVLPTPAVSHSGRDWFGNAVTHIAIQEPHSRLSVHARNVIEVDRQTLPEPSETPPWDSLAGILSYPSDDTVLDAVQFAFDSPYTVAGPQLAGYVMPSFPPRRPVLAAALDLMHRIHRDFRYDTTATDISTPVDQVFEQRRGVCQDFAHLMLACLRALALPGRYISGYILTKPPPGRPKLIGSDASHAWLAVWCGAAGWVELDPTNDLAPTDEHIAIAWGRDYGDVSPVGGVILGGGTQEISVAVDVTAIAGSPAEEAAS